MKGSAPAVLTALILLATPQVGPATPPAMPEQVPELMCRSILPVTSDVPTCASVADRSLGESDYLVVGLANGTINVFHPSGSDMIVRVIELDRTRSVDDVCAINFAGARSDFALLALQENRLSVMSSEVSEVKETLVLPAPAGEYAFARVPGMDDAEGGRVDRALLHDDQSVFEVRVGTAGQRWSLALEPVLSDSHGLDVHGLSDRAVLTTSSSGIREFTAREGLLEPPNGLAADSVDTPTTRAIIPGELSDDRSTLAVSLRDTDGLWSFATVPLEDELTLAVTVWDSMLLLGGATTRDELRRTGWLTLVDARGRIVATGEHGRTVAAATVVGEWLAVQGERQNLSLYDLELTSIWDNSSLVGPLALLPAHLNADESEDLVVIGMRMFAVETERVDAIREVLDRPGFMDGAEERGNKMYLDRPMLNVYYSSAGELTGIMEDRLRLVDEHRRTRDYVEAARHAFTARAAAAAMGHWDTAESLREHGATLLAMPRRDRSTLIAAVLLLFAGLWYAANTLMHPLSVSGARTWWTGEGWVLVLLIAAAAVWRLLGVAFWSPALVLGGVVAGVGASVARLRGGGSPVPRIAGAAIEELELRIGEFIHGGDGSSQQGRKKLTTLAYLLQEMLASIDDPERHEMLRERLELRYKSFYPSKYELARQLPDYARDPGVAVEETEGLAAAVVVFHDAMTVCCDGSYVGDSQRAQEFRSAVETALAAYETARSSADAAAAIVRRNPGCSVTACIDRVLDERREVLEGMHLEVKRDLGIDLREDAVAIQRAQLQFVVENLVTNALRAMDDTAARRLSFAGTAKQGVYELRVTDTGCGIPGERLREIFIPRASESVIGGLGLPHSREILRRVSGNIEVEHTEVGVGTTVLVSLRYWVAKPAGEERE